MAKRRKEKDDEEELDFKIPKFDEKKFIIKEKTNIKITFISFIFGFIISILSFGFWVLLKNNSLRWSLVFLFGFFCAAWLRYLFIKLQIDFNEIGRKGQFSSFAVYFFSWLLILIVLINPPIYDEENPHIELVILPSVQELGGTVKIVARVVDNSGIDNIEFNLKYQNVTLDIDKEFIYDDSFFIYEYKNIENLIGVFDFSISVTDKNGLNSILAVPSDGDSVTYATTIKFDVKANPDRVYYMVNNGQEINTTFKDSFYETYPKFKGWNKNTIAFIDVYAELIHYFPNSIKQFNNTIVDSESYSFNVSNAAEIGIENPPDVKLPKPKIIQVPGFELVISILSIVGLILIIKNRKVKK
jgi:hypothetical protein